MWTEEALFASACSVRRCGDLVGHKDGGVCDLLLGFGSVRSVRLGPCVVRAERRLWGGFCLFRILCRGCTAPRKVAVGRQSGPQAPV